MALGVRKVELRSGTARNQCRPARSGTKNHSALRLPNSTLFLHQIVPAWTNKTAPDPKRSWGVIGARCTTQFQRYPWGTALVSLNAGKRQRLLWFQPCGSGANGPRAYRAASSLRPALLLRNARRGGFVLPHRRWGHYSTIEIFGQAFPTIPSGMRFYR